MVSKPIRPGLRSWLVDEELTKTRRSPATAGKGTGPRKEGLEKKDIEVYKLAWIHAWCERTSNPILISDETRSDRYSVKHPRQAEGSMKKMKDIMRTKMTNTMKTTESPETRVVYMNRDATQHRVPDIRGIYNESAYWRGD
ncbi:MAG: hypothetical protein Q9165_006528 [Trypethelium subeluteriae]